MLLLHCVFGNDYLCDCGIWTCVGVRVWVYACWFTRVGACEKQSDQKLAGKIKVSPSTVSPPTDLPLNCSLKASVVVAKVRKVPPKLLHTTPTPFGFNQARKFCSRDKWGSIISGRIKFEASLAKVWTGCRRGHHFCFNEQIGKKSFSYRLEGNNLAGSFDQVDYRGGGFKTRLI